MEQISKRLMNWASILEDATRAQAMTTSRMPFVFPHLALMPDAHLDVIWTRCKQVGGKLLDLLARTDQRDSTGTELGRIWERHSRSLQPSPRLITGTGTQDVGQVKLSPISAAGPAPRGMRVASLHQPSSRSRRIHWAMLRASM